MASPSKAHNADSLSLATRYSLLRGRHLSMEKYWNERHCNNKKHIDQLETRNSALIEMLQIAQNEINTLKQRIGIMESNKDNNINNNITSNEETEKKINNNNNNLDLNMEYKQLINRNINKSIKTQNLLYELLRECLFLSDPYNIRVLVKRSKTKSNKNDGFNALQSSLSNILSFRKQNDYECDCFAIHYVLGSNDDCSSYSTRLVLMRNSLIICGVGISSTNSFGEKKTMNTLNEISIELYTIAGIYISNNDPCCYCNSMIIACCKDLTVAAHGINPLDTDENNNIIRYEFNIFSDSHKLIHSLTERLPDYVWHINNNQNRKPQLNQTMKSTYNNQVSSSTIGRLGAGLYAGITGVVMDPIRGGQNHGMKGFLRGIASGISGVAMKPITHFRSYTDDLDSNKNMLSPPIKKSEEKEERERETEKKEDIRSALVIPDSPAIFVAESMSESGSIASSTITTNTLDSSKSGQSSNIVNNDHHQSQIFTKHKMMQRQQYLSTIDSKKQSKVDHTLPTHPKDHHK